MLGNLAGIAALKIFQLFSKHVWRWWRGIGSEVLCTTKPGGKNAMNPNFSFEHPELFIGKKVIVDVITYDHNEQPVERRELYGTIVRATEGEGIVVDLEPSGGEYR